MIPVFSLGALSRPSRGMFPLICTFPVAKAERLKQAKDEAAREVAMFKAELEARYAESIEADATDNEQVVAALRAESDAEISTVTQSMDANKARVLELLLTQVKTVGAGR